VDEPPCGPAWIITVSIDDTVMLPAGGVLGRDDFHAWLWDQADGLLGIDEGGVSAADAAARGLVPLGPVIDAAAAPPDRDWVAGLPVADAEWCFRDEAAARNAVALVAGVRGCRVHGTRERVPDDHEHLWRASFRPIAVPDFGTVVPAWEQGAAGVAEDGDVRIFIEPGLGFGTGLHETTQMCLAALADRRRCGGRLDRVLDFGSGSGILGIAAAVLGARRVDAVEIDTGVHGALRANARRNGVDIRFHPAAALGAVAGIHDVVVANIVAPVLVEHCADLCGRVAPGDGELILSGLLADETPAVADRYADRLGVRPRVRERGPWRCLSFSPR